MNADRSRAIADLFSKYGLRCTRQRRALYDVLISCEDHPTADDLFRSVSERIEGLSLATVYNTLEAFCRAGLANKIPSTTGCCRYDATLVNHLHLRCERTGRISDVPPDLSQKLLDAIPGPLLAEIESQTGCRINQVQVELVGEYV